MSKKFSHAGVSKKGTGPGTPKPKDISDLFIEQVQRTEKLEEALVTIMRNIISPNPSMHESNILRTIEAALGKEKYEYWRKYYE